MPQQIKESLSFIGQVDLPEIPANLTNIAYLGMGGSAIAGDILSAYLLNEIPIPFSVFRNYTPPKYVGPNTLVLASSYSGNTEETLSAVKAAHEKKATIITLSSGGELADFAGQNKIPLIRIPEGLPPRQALGYMFFPFLHVLEGLGLIQSRADEIQETAHILEELSQRNDPANHHSPSLCRQIAQKLYRHTPVIYSAAEPFHPVATRWRNQFSEIAKVLAFSNQFPEMNHNEIMGWEAPTDVLSDFDVILLRDQTETPRNQKRLEITRDILMKKHIPVFEIFGEGSSLLARLFSQIYMGDWVSYHLALLYGQDPLEIKSIDKLKKMMQEN